MRIERTFIPGRDTVLVACAPMKRSARYEGGFGTDRRHRLFCAPSQPRCSVLNKFSGLIEATADCKYVSYKYVIKKSKLGRTL